MGRMEEVNEGWHEREGHFTSPILLNINHHAVMKQALTPRGGGGKKKREVV